MIKQIILVLMFSCGLKVFAQNNIAITTSNLNLRESNSINSASLKIIKQGDTLEILIDDPSWSKVKFQNIEGYVSSEYLTKISKESPRGKNKYKRETFAEQKGFVAGFQFVFIRFFLVVFFLVAGITTYFLRKRDARFSKGYREGKMSDFSTIKLAIYSALLSLIAGFIGGLISIFH